MSTSRRAFLQKFSATAMGASFAPSNLFSGPVSVKDKDPVMVIASSPVPDNSSTADIIVSKLIDWKVEVVFGMIGDGVNPIIEALRKRRDSIRLITVRHEEAAAFMASGYAKFTGKLGVCIATTGPGALHLANGLYDAAMENTPVLAITGTVNHDLVGTHFTQEVDTTKLYQNAAIYNQLITGPLSAFAIVDLACRAAKGAPGLAHITVCTDTQLEKIDQDKHSEKGGNLSSNAAYLPSMTGVSDMEALEQAALILNSSSKIMILAGRGALQAREALTQTAGKLGAPVAKALLAKSVLADDSEFTTGGIGNLGTLPSKQMIDDCDVLLILGSNMPHLAYYPKPGQAKVIQIDRDPKRIGLRHNVDVALIGDVNATLNTLLPKINYHSDRTFLQTAQQRMKSWRAMLISKENANAIPIKPQYLAAQVASLLTEDAAVAIDTGVHTAFTARHWQIRPNQQLAVSGNLASMAPALPYAIAAQIAYPHRQCVAIMGDGGFTMFMGEIATAVLYKLPVKVVVFKNNSLAMDRFEQEDLGNPGYGVDLQPIDFAKVAEACGAKGYSCTKPAELKSVLKTAFAHSMPAVIEVWVDPDERPLPPEKLSL